MADVIFVDEKIGNLIWELPADIASSLELVKSSSRHTIMTTLEREMRAHMHLLLGALRSERHGEEALKLINDTYIELGKKLIELEAKT